jgi:ribosome-associated translation inhibitor RaiA
MLMEAPVEIHFHGLERSDAIERRVRAKVSKLAKHFERMTRCRVVVEAPHRNPQRPKVYLIKIEIAVPGRSPIVVMNAREGSDAAEELGLALRDAFEAARRKLNDVAARLAGRSKVERGRRRRVPEASF